MSDPRFNNRDMVQAIIETAAEMPQLWMKEHVQYNDRNIKRHCYERLSDVMKTWIPESTPNLARTKWNNLKTSFVRQRKEVEETRKNGGEDNMKMKLPTLWYYNLMQFLEDSLDTQRPTTVLETESVSSGSDWGSVDETAFMDMNNATSSQATLLAPPAAKRRRWQYIKPRPLKAETPPPLPQPLDPEPRQRSRTVNECFSEFMFKELDDLEKTQAFYARKLMHDVVFYGKMNMLSGNSKLNIPFVSPQLQPGNLTGSNPAIDLQSNPQTVLFACDRSQHCMVSGLPKSEETPQ